MILLGRVLQGLPVQKHRELNLAFDASAPSHGFQQKVQHLIRHQPIGEDPKVSEWLHGLQSVRHDIRKVGVQGGFPAHEIYQRSGLDPRQQLFLEKVVIHRLVGSFYVLLHIFIGKAIIAF